MPLPVLSLPPDQSSYSVEFGQTAIAIQLQGGASRFRADQLGAAFTLGVQWTCNLRNYNYLTAFYRTAINFGSDPFQIDLILDTGGVLRYTAHFLPKTFQLAQQMGSTYVVSATLEVLPDASYYAGDAAAIAAGPDV